MKNIKINHSDLQTLIISSVRYALGRQTYIVSVTCRIVKEHISNIDKATIDIICRDISIELDSGSLSLIDKEEWLNLINYIKR